MLSTTQLSSRLSGADFFLPKNDIMVSAREGGSEVASLTPASAPEHAGSCETTLPLRRRAGMLSIEFCELLLLLILGTLPRRARYAARSLWRTLLASVV
jgi:hypothetical protein